MCRVYGSRLSQKFGVRTAAEENLHLRLKKWVRLQFLPRNICGQTAEVAPILPLRLTHESKNCNTE